VVTFDGASNVTGTTDSNSAAANLLQAQTFTNAYAIANSGRGTIGNNIFYLISPTKYLLIDAGVGVAQSTIAVGEK
jgi:hypothetical protein